MKDNAELNVVYHKQYGYCEDSHGYYMDAPEMIPSGSMIGWGWPAKKFILREGN